MKRLDVLLCIAIGLSLGIAFGTFFSSHSFDAIVIVTLSLIAYGFSMYGKPFFVSVMALFLAILGGVRMGSDEFLHWKNLSEPNETLRANGVVTKASIEKSFFQESEIQGESCESHFCPSEKILLRERIAKKRMPGERIEFSCDLKRPEEVVEIAGRKVAYQMMLAARGIGYLCEKPISIIDQERSENFRFAVKRMLFSVKENIVAVIEQSVPATEAALSLGMLIGEDGGFSSVEKNLFIRTGVTHVTAVSGYNITLVGGLLFFLAILLGWYRRGASLFAIVGIIVYVIFVGAPASAVRAGVMGSLLLLALCMGRPGSGFRIWFLALAFMLAWSPLLLRYDLGFEFSYLATLAILLYASVRHSLWMPRPWLARIFYEAMVLSLFVEWLVMPFIIFQLGNISVVSIVANTTIVLLVPLIMFSAFFTGLVGMVIPGGIFIFSWLTFFLAHVFIIGARFLESVPGSFISGVSVSLWWIILWYGVTGCLFWLWKRRLKDDDEGTE